MDWPEQGGSQRLREGSPGRVAASPRRPTSWVAWRGAAPLPSPMPALAHGVWRMPGACGSLEEPLPRGRAPAAGKLLPWAGGLCLIPWGVLQAGVGLDTGKPTRRTPVHLGCHCGTGRGRKERWLAS